MKKSKFHINLDCSYLMTFAINMRSGALHYRSDGGLKEGYPYTCRMEICG